MIHNTKCNLKQTLSFHLSDSISTGLDPSNCSDKFFDIFKLIFNFMGFMTSTLGI